MTKEQRQPHWVIPVAVGTILALAVSWFGLNDWRAPWVGASPDSRNSQLSVSPVNVALLEDGAVDVSWSPSNAPELHGYIVYVTAVRPISYEYAVPRYDGDPEVSERIYPKDYLDSLLAEAGEPERVAAGQVWNVCVQGMKETPLNVPIDEYIIPGTRACSDDFTLP